MQVILGETLIAEARRTELSLEIPKPPSYAEALAAQPANPPPSSRTSIRCCRGGTGFHPICFCCGADVAADEGLHVYAAPVAGFDGVAAAWQPSTVFADDEGLLPEPVPLGGPGLPGTVCLSRRRDPHRHAWQDDRPDPETGAGRSGTAE